MSIEWQQRKWATVLERITVTCEYKPEWANGTGYFSDSLMLSKGHPNVFKFVDDTGRNAIVFLLAGHRVCVFERYSPGSSFVLVGITEPIRNDIPWEDEKFIKKIFGGQLDTHVIETMVYAITGL